MIRAMVLVVVTLLLVGVMVMVVPAPVVTGFHRSFGAGFHDVTVGFSHAWKTIDRLVHHRVRTS